ncbi:MAG TPA: SprT family zinc-dependent metalloprotease [Parvularculaceae bacterium]|nr:SprT family zinc-dependent metalloprotease [Parvularculaceae bacterium]
MPSPRALLKFEMTLDLGDRLAPATLCVNRRAKRLIVKVDAISGRILVTAPSKRAVPEALRFAQTRAPWIKLRLAEGGAARPFFDGGVCPFRGVPHRVVNEGSSRAPVRLAEGAPPSIFIGGEPAHLNRRLVDWLKREAHKALDERAHFHAAKLGMKITRISLRDTRSRWGSCSRNRALSFSWRLILAPPEILDSVAAHECAHLVHLDHSPAFWRTVASLGVDEDACRLWLEAHGGALHAWGVEPAKKAA